ncbi:hypothetical protein [Sphingobium fluviale]|uniref:Uncharacterized protein n=1 Tax=Sphingobium fluviale TaxID=2506423 RepID=A0A4V1N3B7_9SPHN|nr:hypothetical protein [Sphingobium fluviale]RXR27668.1 hypothetical protein EQG66_11290 [Sphingobium fluviale]
MRDRIEGLAEAILQFLSNSTDENGNPEWVGFNEMAASLARWQFKGNKYGYIPIVLFEDIVEALEQAISDDLLEARSGLPVRENFFRVTDHYVYESAGFSDDLVIDTAPTSNNGSSFDSSMWTGVTKVGVLTEESAGRLKTALIIVEDAVMQSGATNQEKAQARAYILALHALADAPEPPAELIWKIVQVVSAITGIGSFFVSLMTLYK